MKLKLTVSIMIILIVFLAWRFIRPMNIFVVDDRFAWPVDTAQAPQSITGLAATDCGSCHQAFYEEWQMTIHSQAWTDPYFQRDWHFEDAQPACRLCHTPLDVQLPYKVVGYSDEDKWDPIVEENPSFDPVLQHEGVTCAACHYRDGKIVGVYGDTDAPHPVRKIEDPNQVCVRCHIVDGDRWDTFYRFPACGTVAEIQTGLAPRSAQNIDVRGSSGEVAVSETGVLGCVECHMPLVMRPLVEGGVVRASRQHLWRGGHNVEMVKSALTIEFAEKESQGQARRVFGLTVTNTGAAHYVPTGTPDRHLTVSLRLLDEGGEILSVKNHTLERTVMWRPLIVDLQDTRLPRGEPREYELEVGSDTGAVQVEAEIRYHLLAESRRERIEYENRTPIDYEVFRQRIPL